MVNLQNDAQSLYQILSSAQVIAVVGYSDRPYRPSYQIAQFLRNQGYQVYPVNPRVKVIDGHISYASLQQVPEPIDIVNVFRRSEYLPEIVDEAISVQAKTIWAQIGVSEPSAAQKALEAGLNVIMDTCIKVEYLSLGVNRQQS